MSKYIAFDIETIPNVAMIPKLPTPKIDSEKTLKIDCSLLLAELRTCLCLIGELFRILGVSQHFLKKGTFSKVNRLEFLFFYLFHSPERQ